MIAVTVKIQICRMAMIDQGGGEEVVWGRFWKQWTTNSDSSPPETPLNICRLAIGHCEGNRGQWPQVTLFDLENHMMQCQESQLVMNWHQSQQLSPLKSIVIRTTPSCVFSRFRWNPVEGCSSYDVITSWHDLTWPNVLPKVAQKMPHKLWKLSARYSKVQTVWRLN